jgi:hypothetical protein
VEARAEKEETFVPVEEIAVWIDPLDATQVMVWFLLQVSFYLNL